MTEEDLVLLGRLLAKAPADTLDQAAQDGKVEFLAPGPVNLSADSAYVLVDGLLSVRLPGRATSVEYVARGYCVSPELSCSATSRAVRETRVVRLPGSMYRWLGD